MTKQTTVNAAEIQSIIKSPTALALMRALAGRERDREVTDLRRFRNAIVKDGTRIDHAEYYKFFKELEAKGAGHLKMGKGGDPSRFVWSTSMKQVGTIGVSGIKTESIRTTSTVKPPYVHKTIAYFQVRGTTVRIELPGDVTEAQVNELGTVLRKL